jgi:hypothetical protein
MESLCLENNVLGGQSQLITGESLASIQLAGSDFADKWDTIPLDGAGRLSPKTSFPKSRPIS